MKKMLFIAVVAAIALMAIAAPAFADKGSFVTNAGSTAGSYIAWSTALNGTDTSPHGNYTTTTVKCAVCHAVHQASSTGEILLKTSVSDSCNYCHVSATSVYSQVYGENPAYLTLDSNAHHTSTCGNCHSVHGAGTFTGVGAASLILKLPNTAGTFTGTIAQGDTAATASYDDAVALTCARGGCHNSYYVATSSTGVNIAGLPAGGAGYATNKTHPMRANTASWNGAGSGATKTGLPIAFKSSATCKSCHDAEERWAVDGDGYSFPHYTPEAPRFLMVAADAGAALTTPGASAQSSENTTQSTTVAVGAEPAVPLTYGNAVSKTLSDGVCLKCHRDGTGSGVGQSY